jgi:hypothetical protein
MLVVVPVIGLHKDQKYYPNPEKFDPNRFSEDVKNQRPHFTYLPFGEGPRVCIGKGYIENLGRKCPIIQRAYIIPLSRLYIYMYNIFATLYLMSSCYSRLFFAVYLKMLRIIKTGKC